MREAATKDQAIRWMNALNWATTVVVSVADRATIEDVKKMVAELANFLYELEPSESELEKKINEAKTIEDLNAVKEEVVKTDKVSVFNLWNTQKIKLWA